uniref:RING-type E3 ubiquitin transferase n=1 Tax=Sus scrofa TaxID=9823 RepID=A0A8D0NAQ6_PIG
MPMPDLAEILLEPVTLPCNHTLCKPCFQWTVEKADLFCPFCCRWVSLWTQHHARTNSLVNMELWKIIQKHYPKEGKLRASGQESEEIVDDYQPACLLSKPGELRREYEEELNKVEAENRQRELEEQLKSDEGLARKLSLHINNFCEGNVLASPLNSKKTDPVTTKSQKKSKNKPANTGAIQMYLSPKSQLGSASQSEVVQEDRKSSMSKEADGSNVKNSTWQDMEIEDDMPILSPQICLEVQEQGTKSSMESPMPQLCASGREWCHEGKIKTKTVMRKCYVS